MALDVPTQTALTNDAKFRLRVKNALMTVAHQVLNENPATTGHAQRAVYARNAIQTPDAIAGQIANWIVVRPNVAQSSVTFDTSTGAVVMILAATDADLQSQIATDWTNISGA